MVYDRIDMYLALPDCAWLYLALPWSAMIYLSSDCHILPLHYAAIPL